ncbi:acyltransferase family protein [Acidimangrovimonas sediminis]|uniref:acyltransferase family protein n=1 Tax=Acidimangrovimonas sediminis TaxID=2056283 RepID=UPI001304F7E8|nr:acyltransferase [Acidimangrovimonas sediminis]
MQKIPQTPAPDTRVATGSVRAQRRTPARTVASLDLLRLLAAFLVVVYHYYFYAGIETGRGGIADLIGVPVSYPSLVPYLWWGWVGVYVFFVISGYVITLSAEGRGVADFAIGRFTRLFPALFVFASAAWLVVLWTGVLPAETATLRYLKALVLSPKGPWIDGGIWTLTVEAMFYLLIAIVIALGADRWLPRAARLIAYGPAVLVVVSFAAVELQLGGPAARVAHLFDSYAARFFLVSTGSFFATGMLAHEIRARGLTPERLLSLGVACVTSGAALYLLSLHKPGVVDFGMPPLLPTLIWGGVTLAALWAIAAEARRPVGAGLRRLARSVGLMTYPLYLVNQITGAFLIATLLGLRLALPEASAIAIVLIFLISFGFARWVEPPFRRLLTRALDAGRHRLRAGRARRRRAA